jgi:hypothetical protein
MVEAGQAQRGQAAAACGSQQPASERGHHHPPDRDRRAGENASSQRPAAVTNRAEEPLLAPVNDTRARRTARAASVASVGRRLARRRGRQVQCGRTRSRCQRSSVAGETTRTLRDQPLRTPGSSGRNRVVSTASVSLPLRLAAHHEQVKQQGHQWGAG